jgi:hypothetical protein
MANKRGRPPGFKMPEEHRTKIKHTMIRKRLEGLVAGENDMPAHAVTAALGLLRKVLPDLANVQHSGDADSPVTLQTIVTGVPRPGRDIK